jgi:hypothetical protein
MSWEQVENMVRDLITTEKLSETSSCNIMNNLKSKKAEISKMFKLTKRVKKNPDAPKKWNTSYIIFCTEQRSKIKKENASLSATEVTTRLGQMWKSLSADQKKKYEQLSLKDKERYTQEMKDAGLVTEKKSDKPKRPLSSYILFCQEQRAHVKSKNPNATGTQITTLLGQMWKELSQEDKARYSSSQKEQTSTVQETQKETANPIDEKTRFFEEQTTKVKGQNPKWSKQKIQAEVNRLWLEKDKEEDELSDIEDE